MRKDPHKDSKSAKEPLRGVLESLVVPPFREFSCLTESGEDSVQLDENEGQWTICGFLGCGHLVWVGGEAVDHERTLLRFHLVAGVFLDHVADVVLLLGALLEGTTFHVRAGVKTAQRGRVDVGCDLVVRKDDGPLVYQRTLDLITVGRDLEWFFPLRMAERLSLADTRDLEVVWEDLPHGDLGGFLNEKLQGPRCDRPPRTLLRIAHGLGRWKEVLQIIREHGEDIPAEEVAVLQLWAHRGLEAWDAAIAAAEEGGLKEGRFENEPWLNPAYVHALIESGRDIEALQLLGQAGEEDPIFYQWLRGLALERAGDREGSLRAFRDYYNTCSGDLIALVRSEQHMEDMEG